MGKNSEKDPEEIKEKESSPVSDIKSSYALANLRSSASRKEVSEKNVEKIQEKDISSASVHESPSKRGLPIGAVPLFSPANVLANLKSSPKKNSETDPEEIKKKDSSPV